MKGSLLIKLSNKYFDFSRLLREARVIDGQICYPLKCNFEIGDLYYTRYKLHKQIYTHSVVRSIEFMILDLLKLIDKKLDLSRFIKDIDKFVILTDNILSQVNFIDCLESKNLLNRIKKRDLYKLILEVPESNFDYEKEFKTYRTHILNRSIYAVPQSVRYRHLKKENNQITKCLESVKLLFTFLLNFKNYSFKKFFQL